MAQEIVADVGEELAREVDLALPEDRTERGVGEGNLFCGAGERDVEEAAFFFSFGNILALVLGATRREEVLFHAGNEHLIELEPFCGVDGHEAHRILFRLHVVLVGLQRDVGEQLLHPLLSLKGIVAHGDGHEFAHVGESLGVLVVSVREHLFDPRLGDDEGDELGGLHRLCGIGNPRK